MVKTTAKTDILPQPPVQGAGVHSVSSATTSSATPVPGRPQSPLELLEPSETPAIDDDSNIVYPTGRKLWLTIASIILTCMTYGLDLPIVAAAVPSLTDHFKSIKDIGWYSAVYGLVGSSSTFFWSRSYTIFPVKHVYMASIIIFEIGALVATIAPTSKFFILGRAISGLGGSGMGNGSFIILTHSFPLKKRPMWVGIISMTQTGTMAAAPLLGGALIDAFSWRACFGINLPLGTIALASIWFGFNSPVTNPEESLPLKQKLIKLDPLGTLVFVPSVVCLLLALQWGGMTYSWRDARIILLFVIFGVLILAFSYRQYLQQEDAMLPPRVLKNRNILAAAWFEACCDGSLALTEYYISIYFQGVRGFTAFKSGYLVVPMIVSISVTALGAGFATTLVGYYMPFMLATSVLAPIATGLLTTLDLQTDLLKVLALLGFVGAAVGLGISAPHSAVSTVLPIKDVPIGMGIIGFVARLLPAIFISASATLFQNRLFAEVRQRVPEQNVTALRNTGLSELRAVIGPNKLRDVLLGYGEAVNQTLYLPVALTALSLVGSLAMEWRSVKKKVQ